MSCSINAESHIFTEEDKIMSIISVSQCRRAGMLQVTQWKTETVNEVAFIYIWTPEQALNMVAFPGANSCIKNKLRAKYCYFFSKDIFLVQTKRKVTGLEKYDTLFKLMFFYGRDTSTTFLRSLKRGAHFAWHKKRILILAKIVLNPIRPFVWDHAK